jgi:AAA ATPase domain
LLDDMVSAIRRGESRSVVLRGEAGIGKTALLEYLVASASDLRVVRAVGVESDMELAFAGLHQLCAPLFDRIAELPAPQRRALEIVFGLSDGAAPDRFLVGLAVLSLLAAEAEQRPLLCVVDDAQWLDRTSALTLAFVARRLLAERVGLVFAAREPGSALQHVDGLDVRGLRNGDARALLRSTLRFRLDERIFDQIIAEVRGNPLALLELPRGLTATQLAGGFGLPGAQAMSGRIQESFVRRVSAVSDDARRLLLLAAAEPVGDPLLLLRASEQLGIAVSAVEAETDGWLMIGERVTFRHPLVRSAVYRAAAVQKRRAVHLALAEATDRGTNPDRRAWHLAAATAGPDEQVALELERSAGRAQARGGLAAAAAFLQRAAALTQDPARRADRALAAVQASVQTGAFDDAHALLATAEAGALDDLQRARVDLLRAQIALTSNRGKDAPSLLLGAAKRLEPLDAALARETYLEALMAAAFSGQFVSGAALEVAEAARGAPRALAPGAPDLLLDGLALMLTEGHGAGAPVIQQALNAFRTEDIVASGGFRWLLLGAMAALEMWDYDTWSELTAREVQLVRDAGALTVLVTALSTSIFLLIFAGELAAAASLLDEQKIVTEASGSPLSPQAALSLAAWRGRQADLSELVEATIRDVVPRGEGLGLSVAQWSQALCHNGLGEYERALAAAQQLMEPPRRFDQTVGLALPELIEAAVRTGQPEVARDGLARLSEMTRARGHRLGAGSRSPVSSAAERGRSGGAPVPGGDRAARAYAATRGARARAPALWRVVAPRGSPRRRARAAADGAWDVH